MPRDFHTGAPPVLALLFSVALAAPGAVLSQTPVAPFDARLPSLRVTDARLDAALRRLASGSPTAAAVLDALARSGLPVTIGTPDELTALAVSEGGPDVLEQRALLAPSGAAVAPEPPMAWVVLRVSPPPAGSASGALGPVEGAWVAVDVETIAAWIRNAGARNAAERLEEDLLAILAHEFVAHVGSIARTRRLEDFCDDPLPGERRADEAGSSELACSLRVENQVRRELNRGLGLRGGRRLPERRSYALDAMHFEQARVRH